MAQQALPDVYGGYQTFLTAIRATRMGSFEPDNIYFVSDIHRKLTTTFSFSIQTQMVHMEVVHKSFIKFRPSLTHSGFSKRCDKMLWSLFTILDILINHQLLRNKNSMHVIHQLVILMTHNWVKDTLRYHSP